MTTATLRSLAWESYEAKRYTEAARLYRQAMEAYPAHPGALATADRQKLAQMARQCEAMAPRGHVLSHRMEPVSA